MAMDNVLEYQGYSGSVEFSAEDRCFFGKLLFINDVIMFDGVTVDELEASFREQVDGYLAFCKEQGTNPDKPCRGQFQVRIEPETHQALAKLACSKRVTLNEVVKEALECFVRKPDTVEHHHVHVMQERETWASGYTFTTEIEQVSFDTQIGGSQWRKSAQH